jgi:type IV secretion system protein VirB10
MNEQPGAPGSAPVTDRRPVPLGVLPRGFQTWLMAGLAIGILAIIFVAGEPEAPRAPTGSTAAPPAPNPDRLREYQERLRAMEARALQETQAVEPPPVSPAYAEPQTAAAEDPLAAERRRREYESLFASNVVLSRRPDAGRPDAGRAGRSSDAPGMVTAARDNPSLDDIADAVIRATTRVAGSSPSRPDANVGAPDAGAAPRGGARDRERTPDSTAAIPPTGTTHRLTEGTLIDAVLTNRLDGSGAAPVNCLVTNPVYSHSGQHVLIPAGARVLGETRPVQALGETRLAVAFHRLVMPDGRTHRLDQFVGMNQIGDSGLRDRVNHHYWSTFGAAGAVGLISGLAQWLGTAGFAGGSGDRTVIIAGGADATSQASLQVMNRFLNRLPTVTIREGHRVKIYLTSDLELPAYEGSGPGTF